MSEKRQSRKSMFSVQNMEELGRLYESDTPVLAYDFKRRMVEGWTPEHSHHRGQLVALTQGLLIVETENERWLFPSQRCAWTPPNCKHAARSVGRCWLDGRLVSGDVLRTTQGALCVQHVGAVVRHRSSHGRLGPAPTARHGEEALNRNAS